MANGYEDDLVKEKSREENYKFANEHLPKDRTNATALYLASDNNLESIWLDKLRIPRANRLILEGDPTKVEAVKRANPGIAVLPLTTHEFFASKEAQTYAPWWYCGLDYECQLGGPVLFDLQNIAKKELLADEGVIYTNLVGQREQDAKQEEYIGHFIRLLGSGRQMDEIFGQEFGYSDRVKKITHEFIDELEKTGIHMEASMKKEEIVMLEQRIQDELFANLPEDKLESLRSYAISSSVQAWLSYREKPFYFEDYCCPGTKRIFEHANIGSPKGFPEDDFLTSRKSMFCKTLRDSFNGMHEEYEDVLLRVMEQIQENSRIYYEKGGMEIIPSLFANYDLKGYATEDSRQFSYISNKRGHMMLDTIHVRKVNPALRNTLDEIMNAGWCVYYSRERPYLAKQKQIVIVSKASGDYLKDFRKETARAVSHIRRTVNFIYDHVKERTTLSPRVKLGNSSLPLLTLSAARKCALEKFTDEQIAEKYYVPNWGRVAAVRANVTMGRIKSEEKPALVSPVKKPAPIEAPKPEQVGCKNLIPRHVYRDLPNNLRMRLDYFMEEAINPLKAARQDKIRRAFSESKLGDMIDNSIEPIRFYTFFDDVQMAVKSNKKITPEFLIDKYREMRDADSLVEITCRFPEETDKQEKQKKKTPSQKIKDEVREMINSGISHDEVWEAYKQHFDSRLQFGAVTAWASPKLASKRAV